jgi:catechol 2,3-dioxygenase-like lactoylglutathione lyase family enzyme
MLPDMRPSVSFVTLGVRDIEATRRFYVDGLGWQPTLFVPGEVLFVQVAHGVLLSLFDIEHFAREAPGLYRGSESAPISLGHLVDSDDDVAGVLDRAAASGGRIVTPASRRDWGGISGYFADPDGYLWEVAHNPGFRVADDGTVSMGG